MTPEVKILAGTAATVGFIHTLIGPDHYLPFIVMSKAGQWSRMKTAIVSLLCGLGHVMSSVILGFVGIAITIPLERLESVEASRGSIAAWMLIGFGFAYFIWGIHRAIKNKVHTHKHLHDEKGEHVHEHTHAHGHAHVHGANKGALTPWILFTIFVFGPCEPLIPLMMGAKGDTVGIVFIASVFSVVTIATMFTIVMLGSWGMNFAKLGKLERFSHALAGAAIFLSGLAIQLLGL